MAAAVALEFGHSGPGLEAEVLRDLLLREATKFTEEAEALGKGGGSVPRGWLGHMANMRRRNSQRKKLPTGHEARMVVVAQRCAGDDMTKTPQEQIWFVDRQPYGHGSRVVVRTDEGRTVAEFPAFDPVAREQRHEDAALACAAPDMARALLSELDPDGHVIACGNGGDSPDDCSPRCRKVTAALRKAGVL